MSPARISPWMPAPPPGDRLRFHDPSVTSVPPSTTRLCPVTKAPAAEARNRAAPATSAGVPGRRSGVIAIRRAMKASSARRGADSSVAMKPGDTALTRTFLGPHSTARLRASWATPGLAERIGIDPPIAAKPRKTGQQNDRPASSRRDMRQGQIAQDHLAAQVERHHIGIIGHVDVCERPCPSRDPGVADKDVQPAQRRPRAIDQRRQGSVVRHVAGDARHAQVRSHARRIGCIFTGDHHPRARIDQRLGNGTADAPGRAGDKGGLAGEVEQAQGLCSSSGSPLWI